MGSQSQTRLSDFHFTLYCTRHLFENLRFVSCLPGAQPIGKGKKEGYPRGDGKRGDAGQTGTKDQGKRKMKEKLEDGGRAPL